jgi:ubiquinone/menaquinone biosynthesis C-methylase UbiE
MKSMPDPTQRFSTRVENYICYRPGYPEALIDLLKKECSLRTDSAIADVGSGTGILSELFLKNGNVVFGIEPNSEMRSAGEHLLQGYGKFSSVPGTAESTTLPSESVDMITAGQAFHWFDREQARSEFSRILKRDGWVVLVWNERRIHTKPFLQDYEQLLLKYATDYEEVNHKNITRDIIASFFNPAGIKMTLFENYQDLSFEALRGRLLSSSYTPEVGHPNHRAILEELRFLFDRHQADESVRIEYDTVVYYGQLPIPNPFTSPL